MRKIEDLKTFEKEANLLPDIEKDKDIITLPKSNLDKLFMQKALKHNIDDDILDIYN